MKKEFFIRILRLTFILIILVAFLSPSLFSQPVVGLDNWFNRETDAKTGKPFHYLWTDSANSGYSRWGAIFTSRGAKITTIAKPGPEVLKKISIYIIEYYIFTI